MLIFVLLLLLQVLPMRHVMRLLLLLMYLLVSLLLVVSGLLRRVLLLMVLLLLPLVLLPQLCPLPSRAHCSLHVQVCTSTACSMPTLHNMPLRVVWRGERAVVRCSWGRTALKW
jgi:hypothetical protein